MPTPEAGSLGLVASARRSLSSEVVLRLPAREALPAPEAGSLGLIASARRSLSSEVVLRRAAPRRGLLRQ